MPRLLVSSLRTDPGLEKRTLPKIAGSEGGTSFFFPPQHSTRLFRPATSAFSPLQVATPLQLGLISAIYSFHRGHHQSRPYHHVLMHRHILPCTQQWTIGSRQRNPPSQPTSPTPTRTQLVTVQIHVLRSPPQTRIQISLVPLFRSQQRRYKARSSRKTWLGEGEFGGLG